MDLTGRLIRGAVILLLGGFVVAAVCLYFDVPAGLHKPRPAASTRQTYTCPMHADVVRNHRGDCPQCGMALVPTSQAESSHDKCGNNAENHPGCCADKSAAEPATELKLPPGHPPVAGWTTDALSKREPASTDTSRHPSH